MQDINYIRVFTKDLTELDKCHNSRARQLIKKDEAEIIIVDNKECLMLKKTEKAILKNKSLS
jgi:hypothetical protein